MYVFITLFFKKRSSLIPCTCHYIFQIQIDMKLYEIFCHYLCFSEPGQRLNQVDPHHRLLSNAKRPIGENHGIECAAALHQTVPAAEGSPHRWPVLTHRPDLIHGESGRRSKQDQVTVLRTYPARPGDLSSLVC